ncbi:MAG TPA: hypothetical protein VGH40_13200 [Roseiarcus sp.]|jgi:hypothetical protein
MKLANYRDPRCHASADEIGAALSGNWREEHIFALGHALELYDTYQSKIAECDARVEAVLKRLQDAAARTKARVKLFAPQLGPHSTQNGRSA